MAKYREISLHEAETVYNALPASCQVPSLSPQYINIDSQRSEGVGRFWVYEEGSDFLLYSFIQTPVTIKGKVYGDIQSPYGYGNPISNSNKRDFWCRANEKFKKWASKNNLIVEFIRAHPLASGRLSEWAFWKKNRVVCSVDLGVDVLYQCKPRTRSEIRKVLRENDVELVREVSGDYMTFYLSYTEHMREIGAKKDYMFPEKYFSTLEAEDISDIFYLYLEQSIVAGIIILRSDKSGIAEYHLGYSSRGLMSVNGLLVCLYLVSLFFQRKNYSELYLGGGRSTDEGDSLLCFKKKIGSIKREFCIYHKVIIPDAYEKLKKLYPNEAEGSRVLFYRGGL